jgi:hypothetical protein
LSSLKALYVQIAADQAPELKFRSLLLAMTPLHARS